MTAAPAATMSEVTATTAAAATAAQTAATGGGGGGGTTISFWSRDSDQALIEPVIKVYNDTHPNQVKATFIPADQFVQKFAAAASGSAAPDLIAVDLIFMPSFIASGEMTDISSMVKALPFASQLSAAHMKEGTSADGKVYSVPFSAEGSVLIYNKKLFKQAGLDPEKAPKTMAEMADDSKKITALGNGTYGFYFSGACAGCNAFTVMPYIWASGGDILSKDSKTAMLTDPAVKGVMTWLHQMWTDKQIPETSKADTGTDFFNTFAAGKIGMVGSGGFAIAQLKTAHPEIDFGVAPLPGLTGGQASFAGGDVIGIPTGSQHVKEATDFISWYLSDDVQINQVAKGNALPERKDLLDNQYSKKDPRYITVGAAMYDFGRTPLSVHYNEIWNDVNGPWLTMIQKSVFDGQIDPAIKEAQDKVTSILSQ
ncbi:MAG: sugar ABC transporter substrate-binding protein [Herpetosiphonaceae bacterium]|nr:sugar ABC transporter substrate-binding protein [Herpetosiphonaceae bacterium]